jgi:transposase
MHIVCILNHSKPYLQVKECYSVIENGRRKDKKRTIKCLGPLDRFDDGQPNFLERLRQSFKNGKPIIAELDDLIKITTTPTSNKFEVSLEDEETAFLNPKNIGYFILDALYDALGIYDVLNLQKSRNGIQYDLNGIAKLLIFGRVLDPDSKLSTFEEKHKYLFKVTSSEDLIEVYRSLDVLDDKSETIQKRMNLKIASSIERNTELCYYDVTNYWFEIHKNDPDETDDNGNVIKLGLRKKGMSKENRREPIVQMGLFIDDNGLPISYNLFPGNYNDQSTFKPAMSKSLFQMGLGRVIVVADGGLNSGSNIAHLLDHGNGYIFPKSTGKSDGATNNWILDDEGYSWTSDKTYKYKSKLRKRIIIDHGGNKRTITEKLISFWSEKQYEKEVHENIKKLARLNALVEKPNLINDKPKDIAKFLTEMHIDMNTGEVLQGQKCYEIDFAKYNECQKLLGYYTLMTSEIDKDDLDIIHKYHGLSRIEDSFRITKSNLETRPVYVRTPEHINAHFLICFCALTMIRLIQFKILKFQNKDTKNIDGWESGLSANKIQDALNSWIAEPLGEYYRINRCSDDLKLILDAFGVPSCYKWPKEKYIRQIKYSLDTTALNTL